MATGNDKAEPVRVALLTCDAQQSVLTAQSAGQRDTAVYSPYGHRDPGSTVGALGFNGELPDANTGHYLLGNGYRAYNPVLMRFNQPDSWSPFGAGGLNAYAYCVGDPVNRRDPTGHMSWGGVLGLTAFSLSLLTLGGSAPLAAIGSAVGWAGTAADVVESGPGGPSPLLWVSIAMGVVSVGALGGMMAADLGKRLRTSLDSPPQIEPLDLRIPLDLSMPKASAPRTPSPEPVLTQQTPAVVRGDSDWFKKMISEKNSAAILDFAGESKKKAPTLQALYRHLPLSESRADGWKLQQLRLRDLQNVRIHAEKTKNTGLKNFLDELEPLVKRVRKQT
ncbi:RHS repeat-associated core domain-containing protein [Pseudomonas wadenswilerensis]